MVVINRGRWTIGDDREVTVFLIGMRFNRPWRVRRWWPVLAAMPRMLRHLEQHPDAGLMSWHLWPGRTTLLVQYWQSPEHLQRFAADSDAPHLRPWRGFMRGLAGSGDVGIFHETYRTARGAREAVYVGMPTLGLGRALGLRPVGAGSGTARQRMGGGPATDAAGSGACTPHP